MVDHIDKLYVFCPPTETDMRGDPSVGYLVQMQPDYYKLAECCEECPNRLYRMLGESCPLEPPDLRK